MPFLHKTVWWLNGMDRNITRVKALLTWRPVYGIYLSRPVYEAWWLIEDWCQVWAVVPFGVKPRQSVHAAPPRASTLSSTIPSSRPHRPIKGWFSTPASQPRRFAAKDRWEAGETGESWGGQWGSIWAQGGCWVQASNWTENSPAITHGLEVHVVPTVHTPCSNKYRPPSH